MLASLEHQLPEQHSEAVCMQAWVVRPWILSSLCRLWNPRGPLIYELHGQEIGVLCNHRLMYFWVTNTLSHRALGQMFSFSKCQSSWSWLVCSRVSLEPAQALARICVSGPHLPDGCCQQCATSEARFCAPLNLFIFITNTDNADAM